MNYREYPDGPLLAYDTGAGMNQLDEVVQTRNYYSANVYANYDETFGEAHHVSATAGFNYETWSSKNVSVAGINLSSINLDDLNLATGSPTEGRLRRRPERIRPGRLLRPYQLRLQRALPLRGERTL